MLREHIRGNNINISDIVGNYNAIGEGAQVLVNHINHAISAIDELEKETQLAERSLAEQIKAIVAQHQKSLPNSNKDAQAYNPYKALLNYQLRDAPYFFGRHVESTALLNKIKENPLTILHSASGSGKTSLIKAGLSAQLLREGHLPLYIRPFKQQPHISIKKAFLPDYDKLKELERFRPMSLKGFLERVVSYLGDQELYIFIDQFEEFFTMQSKKNRKAFAAELEECVESTLPVHWLLALRKEYFSDLGLFKSLNPYRNEYFLDTFHIEDAQEVVRNPAEMCQVSYEDGLIDRIIEALKEENRVPPSQVQLVSHTLFDELQQTANRNVITHQLYDKKRGQKGIEGQPGASGILTSHLIRVLERDFDRVERRIASRLFEELVSSDLRRLIVEEEMLQGELNDFDQNIVKSVLIKLEASRIISIQRDNEQNPAYELAHDYLLNEIHLDPRTLQRKAAQELLASEVKDYQQHQTLLSEEKYNIIMSQRDALKIDPIAKKLLRESRAAIEEMEDKEIRRVQQLAEEQRKRAETEAESARKNAIANRWLLGLSAVLVAVALLAVVFGSRERNARNDAARSEKKTAQALILIEETNRELRTAKSGLEQTNGELKTAKSNLEQTNSELETAKSNLEQTNGDLVTAKSNLEQINSALSTALQDTHIAKNRAEIPAILALAEEILPAGVNPSKDEFDRSMLMAIFANVQNRIFSESGKPPLSLATINEQFRELALFYEQRPVWTTGEWKGGELRSTSQLAFSADGEWAVSTKIQPGFYIWRRGEPDVQYHHKMEPDEKNSFVTSLTMSNDGTHFITVNNFKDLDVWKIDRKDDLSDFKVEKVASPQFPENWQISKLSKPIFSPDGGLVMIGTDFGKIVYWKLDAPDKPYNLSGHSGEEITSLAFSPNGELVASGGHEFIYLWDTSAWKDSKSAEIKLINAFAEADYISALQFSPSSKTLAAGGPDGTINLWNLSKPSYGRRYNLTFSGDPGSLASSIKFSDDGLKIAAGQSNGSIYIWSFLTLDRPRRLDGNNLTAQDAYIFSDDGDTLRSKDSEDSKLHDWEVGLSDYTRHKIRGDAFGLDSMAYLDDQTHLATFGADKRLKLINLETLNLSSLNIRSNRDGLISKIAFSSNGNSMVRYIENFSNDRLDFYALNDNFPITTTSSKTLEAILSESGSTETDTVYLLDSTPNPVIPIHLDPDSSVMDIGISPTSSIIVVSYSDKPYLHYWNIENLDEGQPDTLKPTLLFSPDLDHNSQLAGPFSFSNDGKYLAVGGIDSEKSGISIWEIKDGEEKLLKKSKFLKIDPKKDLAFSVETIAFSNNNRFIAVSDNSPGLQIWDLEQDGDLKPIKLNNGNVKVSALAFSRDDKSLVIGDVQGSLRVWWKNNTPSNRDFYYLEGHRNKVNSIHFSLDGSQITSIGDDGFILTQPTLESLISSACQRAQRAEQSRKFWEKHISDLNLPYELVNELDYEKIC